MSTFCTTVLYFYPHLFPLLTSSEFSLTDITYFGWKSLLVSLPTFFIFSLFHYESIHRGIKPSFSNCFFALNRLSLLSHQVWWRCFVLKVRCLAASLIAWVEVYCMIVDSSFMTGTPSIVVMIKNWLSVFFIWSNRSYKIFWLLLYCFTIYLF